MLAERLLGELNQVVVSDNEEGNIVYMRKKFAVVLIMIAVLTLFILGCGGTANISKPAMAEGATAFVAEGSCTATLNGNVLNVSGTANLMDGTNGIIRVLSADGTLVDEQKFTKSGESISHDFAVTEEWPEVVYGFITFDTESADSQPDEVELAYGRNFQNIEGDSENVIWDAAGVMVVFQSEEVVI